MLKKIVFYTMVLLLAGCVSYEDIQFLGLKNVQVNGIKNGDLSIGANATFHNPNNIKGKLKSADIYVLLKGDTLAHVTHVDKIVVAPISDFNVPLALAVSIDKLQNGILSNLASLFKKKAIELEFIGNIKVASFGFTQTIPINYKTEIEF